MSEKTGSSKPGPRSGRDLLGQAQDVIYDAWEYAHPLKRAALARKALKISADCADAYVLLAEATAPLDQALELYHKGVEAGERALGQEAFENEAGHFWGLLETRPYMRARAGLAQCLWESGKREEALEHYCGLLRLNPNDNQGLRYVFISCLMELGRDAEVEALLKQYDEDAGAEFAWTHALLAFRKLGDAPDSRQKLAAALESNLHVAAFLLGRKKLPPVLPDLVGFGDENEAICYAADNLAGWQASSGALAWLAERINSEKPALLN